MPLKNYYKTLEVPETAGPEDIKKSFRRLALQYHPDRNADNPYSAGHFRDLKEAYVILSDPARRRDYDEERWLGGMSRQARDQVRVSPDWVLQEAVKLRRHMEALDTYRMSHQALRDYVLLLLSDAHMDLLYRSGDAGRNSAIIEELLLATQQLKAPFLRPLTQRLEQLSASEADTNRVRDALLERERQALWDRYFPLIIFGIAIFLCLLWFLYAHRL